jgi:hypothetical protein
MPQADLEEYFKDRTWISIKGKANKLGIHRNEEILFDIRSESHKGYVMSEEQRRKLSQNRRGAKCGSWKGGLTPLHTYFRSILYEWKMDSLKQYNYKCAFTKTNGGDLEIHHINENFSNMITETLNILNFPIRENMTLYNEEELKLINKTFLELNYKYGLGIPLKKSIHQLYHAIYGKENNNEEQFKEFSYKYKLGEFNEQLKSIEQADRYSNKLTILFAAIASACFSVLFGAGPKDLLPAFIIGLIIKTILA